MENDRDTNPDRKTDDAAEQMRKDYIRRAADYLSMRWVLDDEDEYRKDDRKD